MGLLRSGSSRTAEQRKHIEHIRLLSGCGAGLQAIAGPITLALRDLIGAASAALFWLDEEGNPAGFFHDCAPAELKDFYVRRYDDMFGSSDQMTMLTFINAEGKAVGTTLADGFLDRWLDSNIHRYLCAPLGHHHFLDMRLDHGGKGRAAWFAWNPDGRPFTLANVAMLETARPLVGRTLGINEVQTSWRVVGEGNGHFLTDLSGETLIAIHPEAEDFLKGAHLLKQNVAMTGDLAEAPLFAAALAMQLQHQLSASITLPIANGRLVARASRTRMVQSGDVQDLMYIAVNREVAVSALAVEHVMSLSLTPFQREIALFAIAGGRRDKCEGEFGVSSEALKKHLRAIYRATDTRTWIELVSLAI
jgi:hypothetical protein